MFEADDVLDADAGQAGDFFAAQAGHLPAGAFGEADVGGAQAGAGFAEHGSQFASVHAVKSARGGIGGTWPWAVGGVMLRSWQ
ncbi:hypothetical protein Afil01_43860 [Actinorhabdospora filicis]|uniref:Uncharacterized protein n=1 Tax=Actinorhabdospora filicis TaxID=1785913 RepID=A0A9W6WAE5_9ACTN|nr:hypothetical protein Afil01_43860 [Actinorhabdospora filicis]